MPEATTRGAAARARASRAQALCAERVAGEQRRRVGGAFAGRDAQSCAPRCSRRRPSLDVVDMIAPGPAVAAADRAAAAGAQRANVLSARPRWKAACLAVRKGRAARGPRAIAVSSIVRVRHGGARLRHVEHDMMPRAGPAGSKSALRDSDPPNMRREAAPRPVGAGAAADQSAGFQMIAKASSSSWPAARPRFA